MYKKKCACCQKNIEDWMEGYYCEACDHDRDKEEDVDEFVNEDYWTKRRKGKV